MVVSFHERFVVVGTLVEMRPSAAAWARRSSQMMAENLRGDCGSSPSIRTHPGVTPISPEILFS
jgi:hypothetical protein